MPTIAEVKIKLRYLYAREKQILSESEHINRRMEDNIEKLNKNSEELLHWTRLYRELTENDPDGDARMPPADPDRMAGM